MSAVKESRPTPPTATPNLPVVPASVVEYLFVPDGITDGDILDCLSDPKFQFQFAITADGRCKAGPEYSYKYYPDLRTAVREAIKQRRASGTLR